MYSTLPSQCRICSTLRGNLTKEVLLQSWDYWETHYLGLNCPGTTFFAGSLPGWWDFTAELKQHNFNTKVGLHALALVWKGGQLWKCLSGESIPPNCFLCVWTYCKIVHNGWKKIGALSSNPKMFSQDEPGLIFPLEKVPLLAKWIEAMEKDPAVAQYALPTQVGWIRTILLRVWRNGRNGCLLMMTWKTWLNMLIIMIMVHWAEIKRELEWWKMI